MQFKKWNSQEYQKDLISCDKNGRSYGSIWFLFG